MITSDHIAFYIFAIFVILYILSKIIDYYNKKAEEEQTEALQLDEQVVDDGFLIDMVDEDHDYGFIVTDD